MYEDLIAQDREEMGFMASHILRSDPKHLAFTAARYKFVAKMLEGKKRVLEVGAGDGFFSSIVAQHVGQLTLTDLVSSYVEIVAHDMRSGPHFAGFDGGYCLDVLEHIHADEEDQFLINFRASVKGPVIIGMPSLESQVYASKYSKEGHINCKTKEGLRKTMQRHFKEVFMHAMSDEVVHTGIMANYWLAIGVR